MTTEKQPSDIIQSELLSEKTIDGVIFQLFSNRVFFVSVARFEKIGMKIIQSGYEFLDENGGGKFYNIYQFDSFADVDPEVREWAADSQGNKYTHSDAIVIGSLSQKIITDFYLRFNKPTKPTKIFYSMEKALLWTNCQMEEP